MHLTADTYAAAAQRLDNLIDTIPGNPRIRIDGGTTPLTVVAYDWALQLRGAAEALAYHEDSMLAESDVLRNLDASHQPCRAAAERLAQAQDAIWGYLDRCDSPAPHIRERALEDLRGCARDLRIV